MAKLPFSNHSMTLPPGMFMAARKVISHVSRSFPEYVHLIFWEEQEAGVKVRQEIFLEALKPFRFWSVPSNSHRVEPLKSPCGDWIESRAASFCTCLSVGPRERSRAAPQGGCGENELIEGCGHQLASCHGDACRQAAGWLFFWVCSQGREAGCQGEYFPWVKLCPSGWLCSLWSLDAAAWLSLGMDPAGWVSAGPERGNQWGAYTGVCVGLD